MAKKKNTKRALLTSVLALTLSSSMLVGTTFAWFTDSVTSANNIIKSGNLDITLEYHDGTWKDVEGSSEILDADALWEPGYTDVVYLRMKNAGSLALKYLLGVNIISETKGVNVEGQTFSLSDYIYFDVEEGVNGETDAYATREEAMKIATETTKISTGYSTGGELEANSDYVYLAMVIYMPTTVGNEAKHNGTNIPEINLGINVIATQTASENDSFGPDYDAFDGMVVTDENELKMAINAGENVVLGGDIELTGPIVIPASTTYSLRSVAPATVIDLSGYTVKNANGCVLVNNGNLQIIGDGALISNMNTIENYGNLTVDGESKVSSGWNAVYNAGGVLTVNGGTFEGSNSALYSEGGSVRVEGGNFSITAVQWYNPVINVTDGTALVINGGTFTTTLDATRVLDGRNSSTIDINGGTFNGTNSDPYEVGDIYVGDCQTENSFVIDGGTFNCSVATNYKLTVNGGEFNGQFYTSSISPSDYTLTINGGTFNKETAQIMVGGNGWKFEINDGVFASCKEDVYVKHKKAGSGVATINGGTFAPSPSGKVAYRAYILNGSRQAIQIDLQEIYAKKSLVIELWHDNTLLTTTTYLGSYPCNKPGYTTCCVALKGTFWSWDTTIADGVVLSAENIPNIIKVYADGKLTDTFTHSSGNILGDKVNDYLTIIQAIEN